MTYTHPIRTLALAATTACLIAGCGGGGGGGTNPPPPPPPPAAVTYSVQLTDMSLNDVRSGDAVSPTGLPVDGATATRQP